MAHTNDPESTQVASQLASDFTEEQVKDYLRANPQLLTEDPDLIADIMAPTRANADNVVDLQALMIEQLQKRVRQLRDIQADLIEATSFNSLASQSVHQASLEMMARRSFESLVDYMIAKDGMSDVLGLETVTLCIESNNEVAGIGIRGIRLLEQGGVDRVLGSQAYQLTASVEASRGLYGQQAEEVGSEALIRLHFSDATPPGLLALGAKDPQKFHPEQAGDLLDYLARVVEQSVALWLDLPAKG